MRLLGRLRDSKPISIRARTAYSPFLERRMRYTLPIQSTLQVRLKSIQQIEQKIVEAHVNQVPRLVRTIVNKPPAKRLNFMPGEVGQHQHVRANRVVIVNLVIIHFAINAE